MSHITWLTSTTLRSVIPKVTSLVIKASQSDRFLK